MDNSLNNHNVGLRHEPQQSITYDARNVGVRASPHGQFPYRLLARGFPEAPSHHPPHHEHPVPEKPFAQRLDRHARLGHLDLCLTQVDEVILSRQDAITGLLPASTAVNAHGDYTDAWVRDNVYSILAAWGLASAYRRLDEGEERACRLEQSTVKLMRGLLNAMMKQADRVERFKQSLDPVDALHAKYDTGSGDAVVGDSDWGHLQLDATSLFLLMLAQMTASGLRIVFTLDEVNFVQNLVHYISRAYRTPDYGIWERGNKINSGQRELNASSIGMAKAALEAMSGFDLFGDRGGQVAQIHVVPDDIARCRATLQALLPRESGSKEVDAAVLGVIGFPAFAVEDIELIDKTHAAIVGKLQGRYGCKRFLLDGHQTVLEDAGRLHYEADELKCFEHIESEWPLFFSYLLLNAEFAGDSERAADYRDRLDALTVEQDGHQLLPELYNDPGRAKLRAARRAPAQQNPGTAVPPTDHRGTQRTDGIVAIQPRPAPGRRPGHGRHHRPRGTTALATAIPRCGRPLRRTKATRLGTILPRRAAPTRQRRSRRHRLPARRRKQPELSQSNLNTSH